MATKRECKCPDKGDANLISVGRRLFEYPTIEYRKWLFWTGRAPKYVIADWPYNTTPPDKYGRTKIDCTHLLQNILNAAGYKIPYFSTENIRLNHAREQNPNERLSDFFCFKSVEEAQPGDILIFQWREDTNPRGHTAIVVTPYHPSDESQALCLSITRQESYRDDGWAGVSSRIPWTNDRTEKDINFGGVPVNGPSINFPGMNLATVARPLKCRDKRPEKAKDAPVAAVFIDPLVMDLTGDGIRTVGLDEQIRFDHDDNGFGEASGWVARGSGLLMLDNNGNGRLDTGSELFGDATVLPDGTRASNGFQALEWYDFNEDGKIDASDPIWSRLRIWHYSLEDEALLDPDVSGTLSTLDELGIASIHLGSTITNTTDGSGNTVVRSGSFEWSDGRAGAVAEYRFQGAAGDTLPFDYIVDVPSEIETLPDLMGYAGVYSLHQAMARDTAGQLQSLVEDFAAAESPAARSAIFEQLLWKWTGADQIAPDARGAFMDGREVFVLEKFYGDEPRNPNAGLARLWKETYRQLFEMFYGSIMSQTHLKPLYDLITYTSCGESEDMKEDMSAVIAYLQNALAEDPVKGRELLSEFARTMRGLNEQDRVECLPCRELFIQLDPTLDWVIDSGGLPVCDQAQNWTNRGFSVVGTDNADAVKGSLTEGWGLIDGKGGNDVIYGTSRNEILSNGAGDAIMVGGGGNDTIFAGTGADILDGGPDNDLLYGGAGGDKYLLRIGSGQDKIIEFDRSLDSLDTIWLGSNLTPDDVFIRRSANDLVLRIKDTDDSITVSHFYDHTYVRRVEHIQFMDGTVWTDSDFLREALKPTPDTDCIYGGTGDDEIRGLEGQDFIWGMDGNDTIRGDGGIDRLYGGSGDDTLDGGPDWDYLDGGTGNNTYIFGWGHGPDTVVFQGTGTQTVALEEDVLPGDLHLERGDYSDLRITLVGTDDVMLIRNGLQWNDAQGGQVVIAFADGMVWNTGRIQSMLSQGGDFDDTSYGFSGPDNMSGYGGKDHILGLGGDDVIDGGSESDRLEGGAGNDTLLGGADGDSLSGGLGDDILDPGPGFDGIDGGRGNDKYIFNRGYGQDRAYDADNTPGNVDTIRLGADITPADVTLRKSGEDLVLSINGTTDSLTVSDWFWNDSPTYRIEHIEFADGTIWDVDTIKEATLLGTSANDLLVGYATADLLQGKDGSDKLYGRGGDDSIEAGNGPDELYGEAGSDTLFGGADADKLVGGSGNDALDGQAGSDTMFGGSDNELLRYMGPNGNDTYGFGYESGQDVVVDRD
ncbi:MAG: calcium-binding protein, partial [Pseudomonadota bacterium]